jgi:hypothetical protein
LVAKDLEDSIESHHDFRKGKIVRIVTPQELSRALIGDPKGNRHYSAIFLLDRSENPDPLPSELQALVPLSLGKYTGSLSGIRAKTTNDRAGEITFNIGLTAPDGERLRKLLHILNERSFQGHSGSIAEDYQSYNATVYAPSYYLQPAASWAQRADSATWNYIEAAPPEKFQAPKTPCDQAFFVDRSINQELPDPAKQVLAKYKLAQNGLLAARATNPDGTSVALLTAPSRLLLDSMATKYRGIDSIPESGEYREALDVRDMGATVLLVLARNARSVDLADRARSEIASDMRRQGIEALERGEILNRIQKELVLEQLIGDQNALARLRNSTGVKRYVWALEVTPGGYTTYSSSEHCLDQDPGPFQQYEPTAPAPAGTRPLFGHKKTQEEYDREYKDYIEQHAKWAADRDAWESRRVNSAVQWERVVSQSSHATATGFLKLLDLRDIGKVVWQKEVSGSANSTTEFQTDRVNVRGFSTRPPSMETPPSTQEASLELMSNAIRSMGANALRFASEELWLPDGKPISFVPPPVPSPPPAKDQRTLLVADVDDADIVVTIGRGSDVRVGDKMTVVGEKQIKDPSTGAVLETRQVGVATFLVKKINETTCDCTAIPADVTRVKEVKVGMKVKWIRRVGGSR